MKTIVSKKQKIGSSKGARRICLWSLELNKIGLTSGTPISLKWEGKELVIEAAKESRRKVSRVMNHGKELPVIDLKETKSFSLASLGEIGDKVHVEYRDLSSLHERHHGGYVVISRAFV